MNLRFLYFLFFLMLSNSFALFGQQADTLVAEAKIHNQDTLIQKQLDEVLVFPKPRNWFQQRRYTRLVRYVKIVYPYAQIAAQKMKDYEQILLETKDPKEQRKIMKQIETEIEEEWGDRLRDLTFMQGGILLKLIDRQTGESSYDLVTEFRGKFRAFFYQSFARIFGFNLKDRYDPLGRDQEIEYIVRMIEANKL